jgi:flagellar hook-associated protein 2
MGLITSAGFGSGLDLESIISALVSAERSPKETSLNFLELRTNTTISGIGKLKSALSALEDSLENLNASNFNARTATVSSGAQLTATAKTTASSGSFDVSIVRSALFTELSSNTIAGDSSTVLGDGNLTFQNGNGETFVVPVGASDSLASIVYDINNASDNFGITATLVNGDTGTKIIYRGLDTGTLNDFTVTNDNANLAAISDGNGGALNVDQTAIDAEISISGLTITSQTNTFIDPVLGVDLVLDDDATAGSVTVTVAKDVNTVKDNIKQFIEDYNAYIQIANKLGSAKEGAEGELLGDATLRNIMRAVSGTISSVVASNNANVNTLSIAGITTQKDGTLSLNESTLNSLLSSNFDDVGKLFYAADGIGTSLLDAIDPYTEFAGLLDTRTDSLRTVLTRIGEDRDRLDFRISQIEISLRAKFAAMDSLVSQFNFTGQYIQQQMAALIGGNDK